MLIYLLINKFNGKVYVGQTTRSVEERWADHLRKASRGSPFHIHNAIRKWGQGSFESLILKECTDQRSLDECEKLCIQIYRSNDRRFGYNCSLGGDNSTRRGWSWKPGCRPKDIEECYEV